ncbi:hypothetical protein GGR52DRAFT_523611 [Hypoxylon sp. FL1284]|nr:hypothetical protein GGR52DRAFT_523611 [Hypoxylon sp. FL1284]
MSSVATIEIMEPAPSPPPPPAYPLTTTFTPSPGCHSLHLQSCDDLGACTATLPSSISSIEVSLMNGVRNGSCFPSILYNDSFKSGYQITSYSPGRVCPVGMTTAASMTSQDGVWCCPTGLKWAFEASSCTATLTEGVFILSTTLEHTVTPDFWSGFGINDLTYTIDTTIDTTTVTFGVHGVTDIVITGSTMPVSTMMVTAKAKGVFLAGQTMAVDVTSSTSDDSRVIVLVVIVVSALGAGLLLFFIIWWRKWRRPNCKQANGQDAGAGEAQYAADLTHSSCKSELDASVVTARNELEGSPGENRDYGAGISVQKPELEGTPGRSRADGTVYVLSKAELGVWQRVGVAELEDPESLNHKYK